MSKGLKRSQFDRGFLKISTVFGYQIGKLIGEGTYSKVCLASSKGTNKKLACKIISKQNSGGEFINKFLPRELEIIRTINHPNIVKVYKIVEDSYVVYVFMEYCRMGDVLEYIKDNGPFAEEKTKLLFRQIVEAVHYLHNLDVAHRDIKCENIFLWNRSTVKLGDFGFARYCRNNTGELILSNTFCGSTAYAAPEILQGKFYDPKKYDIWALGCILYIMITAQMPFDDVDIKKMVKDQLNRNIQHFDFFWEWCSPNLKRLQLLLFEPIMAFRINTMQIINHPWFLSEPYDIKLSNRQLTSMSDSHLM